MMSVKCSASCTQSHSLQIAWTIIWHKPCLDTFDVTFVSWLSTKAWASIWRHKASTQRSVLERKDQLEGQAASYEGSSTGGQAVKMENQELRIEAASRLVQNFQQHLSKTTRKELYVIVARMINS
jgi:hypothetical protein